MASSIARLRAAASLRRLPESLKALWNGVDQERIEAVFLAFLHASPLLYHVLCVYVVIKLHITGHPGPGILIF